MRKLGIVFVFCTLFLTACGSGDLVTDSALLQGVDIVKLSEESCGKNCTDYMITVFKNGEKTKYEAVDSDLYNSVDSYRDKLKKETGSAESSYNIIVRTSDNVILAVAPSKNTLNE